ncbi:hypothetical protein IV38_GL001617 [Lactobacillus selangorensis]|uniref:Integral membrane protein n=1 Tax=Lactobacillus selangorensis TaxID=81857 RepID=A0A0R2FP71_9LACO|nr:TMEM175 family protein [Lactobacillus selangorensis]KRN28165.1 hypothetical protein IV38_GL001617 [Lactobacillus selangorensis]KRN30959.1 hypothetical protein IV40_GL001598 [Lactobacillus selangorensis]
MNKERLLAFTDAVLAIVMTILVLDLPQPQTATWSTIWHLRESYLAYIISFFGLAIMWNNHHNIFQLVRVIDGRVLWANTMMLFGASLFPYSTKFVEDHFDSFVAEFVYGLVFLFLSLGYFGVYYTLVKCDPKNTKLRRAVDRHGKIVGDFSIKLLGFIIGFWYPPAILLSTICAMSIWVIPERKAEVELEGK